MWGGEGWTPVSEHLTSQKQLVHLQMLKRCNVLLVFLTLRLLNRGYFIISSYSYKVSNARQSVIILVRWSNCLGCLNFTGRDKQILDVKRMLKSSQLLFLSCSTSVSDCPVSIRVQYRTYGDINSWVSMQGSGPTRSTNWQVDKIWFVWRLSVHSGG